MHVARGAMARATGAAWSLRRLRERVLRGGGRLVISARRMTLILAEAVAPFWGGPVDLDPHLARREPISRRPAPIPSGRRQRIRAP